MKNNLISALLCLMFSSFVYAKDPNKDFFNNLNKEAYGGPPEVSNILMLKTYYYYDGFFTPICYERFLRKTGVITGGINIGIGIIKSFNGKLGYKLPAFTSPAILVNYSLAGFISKPHSTLLNFGFVAATKNGYKRLIFDLGYRYQPIKKDITYEFGISLLGDLKVGIGYIF